MSNLSINLNQEASESKMAADIINMIKNYQHPESLKIFGETSQAETGILKTLSEHVPNFKSPWSEVICGPASSPYSLPFNPARYTLPDDEEDTHTPNRDNLAMGTRFNEQ